MLPVGELIEKEVRAGGNYVSEVVQDINRRRIQIGVKIENQTFVLRTLELRQRVLKPAFVKAHAGVIDNWYFSRG